MDDWEKFNETTLPEKEEFYRNSNMEYITDADYIQCEKSLADVFENFRKMRLKIYHSDPAKKMFSSWISMASGFTKD